MGGPCETFASEERRIGVWERGADGVFAERVLAKPADNSRSPHSISPCRSPRFLQASRSKRKAAGAGRGDAHIQPMTTQAASPDPLVIAGRSFGSRLIIGTGKYASYAQNAAAAEAAGAEIVTVALRRVNLTNPAEPKLSDFLSPENFVYLPNTAGCFTAEEALRTLRLAREAGGWTLVKLEVLADQKTLYPDMAETLSAARTLIAEGFQVMVYCSDDPVYARKLEEAGCCAIMPLGSLIGSGLGVLNPVNIRLIIEQARVPVIVDAGVGTASDAAIAMELGADGVLMNTAIAEAKDPVRMARAMRHAVIAGREAYLAGRMPKKRYADPSSPLAGLI